MPVTIRIDALPSGTPTDPKYIPMDSGGAGTEKATLGDVGDALVSHARVQTALQSADTDFGGTELTSISNASDALSAASVGVANSGVVRSVSGATDTIQVADMVGGVSYTRNGAVAVTLNDLSGGPVPISAGYRGRFSLFTYHGTSLTAVTITCGAGVTINGSAVAYAIPAGKWEFTFFTENGLAWFTSDYLVQGALAKPLGDIHLGGSIVSDGANGIFTNALFATSGDFALGEIAQVGAPTSLTSAARWLDARYPTSRSVSGGSDTIAITDMGGDITYSNAGSVAVSLPDLTGGGFPPSGRRTWFNLFQTNAATKVTITCGGGVTINGAGSYVAQVGLLNGLVVSTLDGLAWVTNNASGGVSPAFAATTAQKSSVTVGSMVGGATTSSGSAANGQVPLYMYFRAGETIKAGSPVYMVSTYGGVTPVVASTYTMILRAFLGGATVAGGTWVTTFLGGTSAETFTTLLSADLQILTSGWYEFAASATAAPGGLTNSFLCKAGQLY